MSQEEQKKDSGSTIQFYQSEKSEARSKEVLGNDVKSYTKVQRTTRGLFDDTDLTFVRYDSARDTFLDLEAAYRKTLLQLENERQTHTTEVRRKTLSLKYLLLLTQRSLLDKINKNSAIV